MQKIVNSYGESLDYSIHEAERNDTIILIGHGVTGDKNRELVMALAQGLAKKGWPCVRFSYSGSGDSQGSYKDMCISKEVDDLKALIKHFKNDQKKLVYIGHSMGAAVGALTVADDKYKDIDVLVSLAGMVHTKNFCIAEFGDQKTNESYMWDDENYPLTQLFVDDLTTINSVLPAIKTVITPWLFIHGEQDDVVLPIDSSDIYQQLSGAKKHQIIKDADHSFVNHYPQVIDGIHEFLLSHLSFTKDLEQ